MKHTALFLFTVVFMFLSCKEKSNSTLTEVNERNITVRYDGTYRLSLAQWSLHKMLFEGELDNLQFAAKAKELGFEGVEYVNQFFKDKANDLVYLDKMKAAANVVGIQSLLIMVDGEGYLGDLDSIKRNEAIENHKKWVDAAQYLGCHSIRVNAHGEGTAKEVSKAAIDALTKLSIYAVSHNINVLVENHGGYSSNGEWLANVMEEVGLSNCGTLPDFGNFCLKRENGEMWGAPCIEEYDRYKGIAELMPYAKALSAKSYNFSADGIEVNIDFGRIISIAREAGYSGFVGVEYEGETLQEIEGIIATMDLLKRL